MATGYELDSSSLHHLPGICQKKHAFLIFYSNVSFKIYSIAIIVFRLISGFQIDIFALLGHLRRINISLKQRYISNISFRLYTENICMYYQQTSSFAVPRVCVCVRVHQSSCLGSTDLFTNTTLVLTQESRHYCPLADKEEYRFIG